jgi:hypothetical protein
MNNYLMLFLVIIGIFLLTTREAWSQSGVVSGKVVSPVGQGIGGANVKLISSLGESAVHVIRTSESDGRFRIPLDWMHVNDANSQGATWEVHAEKDGYISKGVNVVLNSGIVRPDEVKIVLIPSKYENVMDKVDYCADTKIGPKTLYLFDLQSSTDSPKLAMFHNILVDKLRNGIRAHLESHRLLESIVLDVKWCHSVPVDMPDDAIVFGQRLKSPGVIWGYVEEQTNQFKSIITFTALIEGINPITVYNEITYSGDIFGLMKPEKTVDSAYLAFAAFILGNLHLFEGRSSLARRCFLHAQELNALPNELSNTLEEMLNSLEQSNIARDLTFIERG